MDTVIKEFEKTTIIQKNVDFKLLKNIAAKKISSRDNFTRIMTTFRKNNEQTQ